MTHLRDVIERYYDWIVTESESVASLQALASRQLAIGQFEVARITLRQLLASPAARAAADGVAATSAVERLLLDVIEHGPPSDWLASPSTLVSVAQLRWLCLHELAELGGAGAQLDVRVSRALRARIEYELLLETAFQQLLVAAVGDDARPLLRDDVALAVAELLDRYLIATTPTSDVVQASPMMTTASAVATAAPTTAATTASSSVPNSNATASPAKPVAATSSASARRISALGSLFSLGRKKSTTDDATTATTATATTTMAMTMMMTTTTTTASAGTALLTAATTTVATVSTTQSVEVAPTMPVSELSTCCSLVDRSLVENTLMLIVHLSLSLSLCLFLALSRSLLL